MEIKKIALLLFFTASCSFAVKAQYDDLYTFEKGKSLIGVNVGVGVGHDNKVSVSAFYEYGLTQLFAEECTLGGGFFGGYYNDRLGNETEKIYIVGTRLNIHYQFVDRLDTYAGVDPNFNIRTYEVRDDKAKFECYLHIGGRYYLTNWLGVFAEISTGYNNFSGGLSVKF